MYPVEIKSVTKTFTTGNSELEILKGINLNLQEGLSVAIVGKSGSGKSTLLNITGLLDNPTSGEILIEGKDTKTMSDFEKSKLRNQYFGYIFQSNLLLNDFNAIDNISLNSMISGSTMANARREAKRLLSELGLDERKNHFPSELSGGEKQKVSICRALINNPKIILADEPTGSLDETSAKEVEDLLIDLSKNHKTALLLVTHNNEFANKCDKVYRLSSGVLKEEK